MTSTSSLLLYTASFLSAISIAGHTQMGSETVYPSLDLQAIGDKRKGAGAAKIGWLEGNMVFGIMGILYAKWAVTGINDGYEMGILAFATAYQFACGVGFMRLGVYVPLLALWITPAVAIAGLVVGLPL